MLFNLPLMFGYLNCVRKENIFASKNTVAGNPMTMASSKIVSGVCSVITRCHPQVTMEECGTGVMGTSGFNMPLGLPPNYSTLTSIIEAENSGTLVNNSTLSDGCYQQITASSCSEAVAKSAYNPTSTQPFSGAVNLVLGQSCGGSLTPIAKYTCNSKVFLTNSTSPPLAPAVATPDMTYSVTPNLPAGLLMDSKSGLISGTPTVVTPSTTYTVTATGPSGTVTNTLKIQTADGYLVNDLGDAANTGGTVCSTANGTCTLRAAINAALNSPTAKVISVPAGTIQLTSQLPLSISKGLEIHGDCQARTVLDGMQKTRVIEITAGPTTLSHLTIQNGSTTNDSGAGISIDAGTTTFTTTLRNLVVQNNVNTIGTSGMAIGGGIGVHAKDSTSQAIVNLSDSTIAHNTNTGGNGGGIGLWFNTHANITNCTISDNKASGYGGGLSSHSGSLNVSQSLFTTNSSAGEGGGLFIDQYAGENSTVSNVTFFANTADSGGAIYVGGMSMTINNSTFAENHSTSPWYGGALAGMAVGIAVKNSVFSSNFSNGILAHCKGTGNLPVTSDGSNLSDADSSDCHLSAAGDLPGQIVKLGTLQDNGGASKTMALLADSPGVDAANPSTCAAEDQRGVARLADGKCDMGAFETQP